MENQTKNYENEHDFNQSALSKSDLAVKLNDLESHYNEFQKKILKEFDFFSSHITNTADIITEKLEHSSHIFESRVDNMERYIFGLFSKFENEMKGLIIYFNENINKMLLQIQNLLNIESNTVLLIRDHNDKYYQLEHNNQDLIRAIIMSQKEQINAIREILAQLRNRNKKKWWR